MGSNPTIRLAWPETRESWEIPVLYEDSELLAVDKPAGLLASPDRYNPKRPNLMKLLHHEIARGAEWARERQITYLFNAHRLDFETSGIMLLAKNKPALVDLANQFGSNLPNKTYVAIVIGAPPEDRWTISAKLAPHPVKLGQMHVEPRRGKKSVTHFETVERFRGFALVKCLPETGRTHQIRVHLKWSKLPIASDTIYGGTPLLLSQIKRRYHRKDTEEERPLIARTALHAERLAVDHPTTKERVEIQAPWPKDFEVAVKYLRKFAQA
ncbi:MAG TPA: RluA family pseudouridine synthase [Methylomirabilota bacterium]|nr:RluA family pseudouridine synthase [Methylomirabilota bacterium]